jgi:carbamoylphosphate synthase small subunit
MRCTIANHDVMVVVKSARWLRSRPRESWQVHPSAVPGSWDYQALHRGLSPP